jgi:peptidoglycan/LPS O-acetylase OafA/YrhL
MKFRKDINGLRAIAVLAVVLFHFSVPHFQGGFVGVDVFFVISGFLMTDIIVRGLDRGDFSILSFYRFRARRIVPALAAMCVLLLGMNWFVLLPSEYRAFGKEAAASVAFVSNITFWREAGYFDTSSLEKWLLHTWSLSVEWQFYLLYPLAMVALKKWLPASWFKGSLIAGALLSLARCVYLAQPDRWPTAAFYLLPTRAWEMLAGGLVRVYPLQIAERYRSTLDWLGLALIMLCVVFFNTQMTWPGAYALVPVAGAMLILAAHNNDSPITSPRIIQFVGMISYSVYLWHWPMVVGLYYYHRNDQPWWSVAGIAASFVLGVLSWRFVEYPTRKRNEHERLRFSFNPVRASFALALMAFVGGGAIFFDQGAPMRFDRSVFIADEETYDTNPHRTVCHMLMDPCKVFERQAQSRAIVLGDSHAEALAEAVLAAIPNGKRSDMILIAVQGCPTLDGVDRGDGKCYEATHKYISLLEQDTRSKPPVIIANHWSEYAENESKGLSFFDVHAPQAPSKPFSERRFGERFLSTICGLAKTRPVYLVKPIPEFGVPVPNVLAREKLTDPNAPDMTLDISEYYQRNSRMLQLMQAARDDCGAHLLDPTAYLCHNGKCLGSYNGRPLYSDAHHMSEYGNRFLVPMFKNVFPDGSNQAVAVNK